MSRINVDFTAVADNDGRFGRLAQLLGLADADHARGKVEHLWVACTTRGETALPRWLVEKHLGELGPEALISAELARWSRGRGDSKTRTLYICGAEKRCLWLRINQEQSSKGGKARALNTSRVAGKFTSRLAEISTSPPAPAPAPSEEESPVATSAPDAPAEPAIRSRRPKKEPNPAHHTTRLLFEQRFRDSYKYEHTWSARYAKNLSELLSAHGEAEVRRRIEQLFDHGLEFPRGPYRFHELVQYFDKLVSHKNGQRPGAKPILIRSTSDEPDLGYDPNKS